MDFSSSFRVQASVSMFFRGRNVNDFRYKLRKMKQIDATFASRNAFLQISGRVNFCITFCNAIRFRGMAKSREKKRLERNSRKGCECLHTILKRLIMENSKNDSLKLKMVDFYHF